MKQQHSLLERAAYGLYARFRLCRMPFLSAIVFGLLAHMYAFTNKLLNADEISALFSKGATVTSGRWGLELTKYLFPNLSMPWIYGIISLLLLAAAVCMTIGLFQIRSKLLQILFAGIFVSFPAIMGNFCFMFTSAPYALAIFLAVFAVRLFTKGGWLRRAAGVLALAFSLGIYQAYISLAASYLVLLLLCALLSGEKALPVLKRGIGYLLLLIGGLALYYAVTFGISMLSGGAYQEYEVMSTSGLLGGIVLAYRTFVGILFSGSFGYVNSGISAAAHLLCLLLGVIGTVAGMRKKEKSAQILAALLILVLPLSINCIYLIAAVDIIHTLVLLSFVSVYVFAAVMMDRAVGKIRACRDVVSVSLAVILISNIFLCNQVYLKMALEYENAFAFYSTLFAQIMETPGFNSETVVDFVGSEAWGVKRFEEIDTSQLVGPNEDLVNIYTRVAFMKYYLGMDLYSYREDIIYADWYREMPSYPNPGSILMDSELNRIVIKLQ